MILNMWPISLCYFHYSPPWYLAGCAQPSVSLLGCGHTIPFSDTALADAPVLTLLNGRPRPHIPLGLHYPDPGCPPVWVPSTWVPIPAMGYSYHSPNPPRSSSSSSSETLWSPTLSRHLLMWRLSSPHRGSAWTAQVTPQQTSPPQTVWGSRPSELPTLWENQPCSASPELLRR